MKGLAFIPFILFLAVALVAFTGAYSYIKGDFSGKSLIENPVEIFVSAVHNMPWQALYDFFFGGLFGILIWLNSYIILPLMSLPFGKKLEWYWGAAVIGFLVSATVWKKKDQIWDFTERYTRYVIMILLVIFTIGVLLKWMGVI